MTDFPHIFSPLTIKDVTLRNRICSTGHMAAWMHHNGWPNDDCVAYFEERAKGGIALMTLGATAVRPGDHPAYFQNLDDRFIACYRRLSAAVHCHGASFIAQLCPRGAQVRYGGFTEAMPSVPIARDIPGIINRPIDPVDHVATWSVEDLQDVVACCGRAAYRARAGDADGVELHAHQVHLMAQFLSPACNRRSDAYGGSFENRARLLVEALAAMRRAVGDDFIVGVRLKASDMHPAGNDEAACIRLIGLLTAKHLIDYVSLTVGGRHHHCGSLYVPEAAGLDRVAAIRAAIDLPVIHAGGIVTPEVAESAIADGKIDVAGMTKGHFADPHFVAKLRAGRRDDIRLCIRCQFCCDGGEGPVGCIYNPVTSREKQLAVTRPAPTKRRVVVVGAGPAGMEAALAAQARGHDVIVVERSSRAGGDINLAGAAPLRSGFLEIANFYQRQADRGHVTVRFGFDATAANVLALDPEVVVVATGARAVRPAVEGTSRICTVHEVLAGRLDGSKSVLIVDRDGHAPAFVAADHLRSIGAQVTVVSAMNAVGMRLGAEDGPFLYQRLSDKGVRFRVGEDLARVDDKGAVLRNIHTDEEPIVGHFDAIVIADEMVPRSEITAELEGRVGELHVIGGAAGGRYIWQATLDGARVGQGV